VLVDPHREVAQDVFIEPHLALDFSERRARRLDVEQRHVRLAVLADAVGKGLHAPIFGLGDLAAHLLDDGLVLLGERLDLLRGYVLTRKVYVFVKRHGWPFLIQCASRRVAT